MNGKKGLRCFTKVHIIDSEIIKEKKSPFISYTDFESILMPEGNARQNQERSNTNKYQKHVTWL